jgi:hypothetical protein
MTAGTDVVRRSADTPYKEIARLLTSRRISAISEADLMAKESRQEPHKSSLLAGHREWDLEAKAAGMTAAELMTCPAVTIGPEADVVWAARLMEDRRVKRLPAVDEQGRLVGIASRRDLIGVSLRSDEDIRSEIAEEVTAIPGREARHHDAPLSRGVRRGILQRSHGSGSDPFQGNTARGSA